MKFLLTAINAKYIHSNPAIYSLRAYAGEDLREHVELAEYTINQSFENILADIYIRKPDVIGFSCYIWNITLILDLVRELHKLLPQVPIWLGGPEVSFDAPKLLKEYPMLTGVMIGEGEKTFQELLRYYVDRGENLHAIAGLCLPDGYTPMRELLDMSELPFLYSSLDEFENKIIYYESSRGCPFRCSYCLSSVENVSYIDLHRAASQDKELSTVQKSVCNSDSDQGKRTSAKRVRLRDLDIVKKELQFFLDHKVKQVKFVDRTFNCNHEHAMTIWRYISENDNGVTNFHFEISADIINEEELALLRSMRPGLVQLEIGVQSTNPDTIKAIHRTMNVDKLEKIVASINAGQNVHQHLDLIAGLPYEDYASFVRSFNQVYAMEPEQLQLGFLKVLKGSPMQAKTEEYGLYYLDKPPYEVLCTKWLSYEDVLRLKKVEEMVELYYNSNQFRHTLMFLEKQFESPFAMFEKLADFYEKKGYFTNSPARAYRYHVLLEFACEQFAPMDQPERSGQDVQSEQLELFGQPGESRAEVVAILRELLTYDLYLRENVKSRPDFGTNLGPHKEIMRRFYEKEEQERIFLPGYEGYDQKQLAKMTHMEPFRYPVWDKDLWKKVQEASEDKQKDCSYAYILFDYRSRSPLTGDARNLFIKKETDWK